MNVHVPEPVVRVQSLESVALAVVRRQVRAADLSRVVPECCGIVWDTVRAQQARAGRNVALYWDDAIRLEAGVEVPGPFVDQGEVVRSATPGGTIAWTTHFGPYASLGAAHGAIASWCREAGRRLEGPRWEIYGHWRPEWDADPSRIRTDVFYLVSP